MQPHWATHRAICPWVPHDEMFFASVLLPTPQHSALGKLQSRLGVSRASQIQKASHTSGLVKHSKEEVPALDFHPVCFLKKQRTALGQESWTRVRMASANTLRAEN